MSEQEIKEIFKQLEKAGWEPQMCDTPIPLYESVHACQALREQISETDKEIDTRVFDLYGLTEEERKVVIGI